MYSLVLSLSLIRCLFLTELFFSSNFALKKISNVFFYSHQFSFYFFPNWILFVKIKFIIYIIHDYNFTHDILQKKTFNCSYFWLTWKSWKCSLFFFWFYLFWCAKNVLLLFVLSKLKFIKSVWKFWFWGKYWISFPFSWIL